MEATAPTKIQGRYLLLAAIILAFSACDNENDEPNNPVSEQDRNFAIDATYSNLAEIVLGQLAVSDAMDEAVRGFGTMMVTEHTTAQDQLSNIAASFDIDIPDTLNHEHRALHTQLSALEGAAFDDAYISSQITAHQEAQQLFQTQIDQGLNPRLKEYASNILPHIMMHLERAMELKEESVRSD